jgi:hypothetical protein
MHQYSNERTSDAIGGLPTNRCVLYFTFAAKYRAQYPVYAMPTMVRSNPIQLHFFIFSLNPPDYPMSTVVPVKSNIVTVLVIQAAIFNST